MMVPDGEKSQLKGLIDILAAYTLSKAVPGGISAGQRSGT